MMIARHLRQASLALLLSPFVMLQSAFATGTVAGTSISNQATVNYNVGGVAQTPITSSVATFVVDNKIDLTVVTTNVAPVTGTPGQTAVVSTFTVTNTGNSTQSYRLTATDLSGGTVFGNTDNLDGLVLSTAIDTNDNGTYDVGDVAGNLGDIAPSATPTPVRVFVLATVPIGATNGQFASVRLTVQAATAGSAGATLATQTAGADTPAAVDVVFADTGLDATEAADSQYAIQSATLVVSKTATVLSDPFSSSNPKAIPGAVVEYTISIENTGVVDATNVAVADAIPANTTYVPSSLTPAGTENGSPVVTDVSVTLPTVAAGSTSTITFRVTIQ